MEKHLYICKFCQKEFEPKRRKAQKFCSATCRSKNYNHKHKVVDKTLNEEISETISAKEINKNSIEKMSASGVGNAALGTLLAETATALEKKAYTQLENKPATQKDNPELKDLINTRYFEVHNIKPDTWGRKAYFDLSTCKILYLDKNSNTFYLPQSDLEFNQVPISNYL